MNIDSAWSTEWYTDGDGNKITVAVSNESHVVISSRFIVDGVPSRTTKLTFVTPSGMVEVGDNESIKSPDEYKVDYDSGIVQVHSDLEATSVTVNYDSRGIKKLSSKNVYLDGDTDLDLQTKLDDFDSRVNVITNIGSNAVIGTYSITASGDVNDIIMTYSDLEYFSGLKINLKAIHYNTGATTVNLNSNGVKNLYKIHYGNKVDLLPSDIKQGEVSLIEYDGTDFILLSINQERNITMTNRVSSMGGLC